MEYRPPLGSRHGPQFGSDPDEIKYMPGTGTADDYPAPKSARKVTQSNQL